MFNFLTDIHVDNIISASSSTGSRTRLFSTFQVGTSLNFLQTGSSDLIGGAIAAQYYLRVNSLQLLSYNNGNTPVLVTIQYMRPRCNIAISEYPTIASLLSVNSFNVFTNGWMMPLTASPTAQKYVKFTKQKTFILNPGRAVKWRLSTTKYNAKLLSKDHLMDNTYLGTDISVFAAMAVDPVPSTNYTGTYPSSVAYTGCQPAMASVTTILAERLSFYQSGQINPTSTRVDNTTIVSGTTRAIATPAGVIIAEAAAS